MQFDDFLTRVQEQARLDNRDEAIRTSRAVLETLGERLDRKVRKGVEAQLPNELKEFLSARVEHDDTYEYDVEEFYRRVGARADLKYEAATERTGQVLSVLRQAVSWGEIEDILEDLPPEYEKLFAPNIA